MVRLDRHISKEKLADLIREETDPRIKERSNSIQHLYEFAVRIMCVSFFDEFEMRTQMGR